MKKGLYTLLLVLAFTLPVQAQTQVEVPQKTSKETKAGNYGQDGFYTRFDIGYADGANKRTERNGFWRAGVGERWTDYFRTEFTVQRNRHELGGVRVVDGQVGETLGTASVIAGMVNAYVDVFKIKGVSPYIHAGAGSSWNKMKTLWMNGQNLSGQRNFEFAWQVGAGIGIDLPQNLILDIGYTYIDLGTFSTRRVNMGSGLVRSHNEEIRLREAYIGLRYNF